MDEHEEMVRELHVEGDKFSTWLCEQTRWAEVVHHHLSLVQEALRLPPNSPVEVERLVTLWLQACSSAHFVCELAVESGFERIVMMLQACIAKLAVWLRIYGVDMVLIGEEVL